MHIIFDLIKLSTILGFAIFSPALAFFLFVYKFLLLKVAEPKQAIYYSVIIGLVLMLASLWRLNFPQLVFLYHTNLEQLFNLDSFWSVIRNSLRDFKTNSLNSGLVGIAGMDLLIIGLLNALPKGKIKFAASVGLPSGYMSLGIDKQQNPFMISYKELNQHTLVIGTTGSGKTSTLMNIVYNCCSQNLPLIYLDGKGSIKLAEKISQICGQFGRKLKIFSIDPEQNIPHLAKYNPLAYGNFTEWKNKIATLLGEAENKGQEHYAIEEQSYINLVCEILNKSDKYVDFEGFLAHLSNPDELQKLANLQSPEIALRFIKARNLNKNNDIIKTLELFYHSHYGSLFSTTGEAPENIINLQQAILDKEIILFLFDAATFRRDTSQLGKLVINDINSAFSGLGRSNKPAQAFCIFDEFAAYASANMSNVLAMQRDNGMHAIIGTQSIHAISQESQQVKRVSVELIANCNTFIIHKINDAHDINLLQETIGKEVRYRVRSISNTLDKKVTTTLNDEYILDGNKIRNLQPGFAYVCRTAVNIRPQIIKFNYI
jgi:hypothetical protein